LPAGAQVTNLRCIFHLSLLGCTYAAAERFALQPPSAAASGGSAALTCFTNDPSGPGNQHTQDRKNTKNHIDQYSYGIHHNTFDRER